MTLVRADEEGDKRRIAIYSLLLATRPAREKIWKESDRIRGELAKMGVVLKDTKDGTTWEIAR